ncbi:MAG: ABC transporter permease [Steroidobacteraceae bacterium]
MLGYALRRIALAVPTLLLVSLIVFTILRAVPGDPAEVMAGDLATPEYIAELRRQMGLDQPLPVQFVRWLGNVVRGDLGTSIMTGEPVLSAMFTRLAVTAQVVVPAFLLALLIAIPAGLVAAARRNTATDFATVAFVVAGLSVPSFWIGLLLILFFGVKLQWLPTVGFVSITEDFTTALTYLALPVVSLLLVEMATVARMTRSSTIEVLGQEYITHARAKGLPERKVIWRHALPNAVAPVLTVAGLLLGSLLGGAAVIETVFTLPGLGRFLLEGIYARDYPVVQGTLLLVAFIKIGVNLTVDLLYPVFDPRVRL